ncbi:accessory gene regulator ArgB-like protein [Schinkia azotoformans]|uniref:accessory gene regulator ArgB-like protein n=1 Tax=Schinkia azotoformans TaxID=1454 RepID=UPI002DBFA770|nr:accessory gene regulator B family protein [Schinkia azotoformans]MEC1717899.1 accessory gene regulator B family protein [Schinkia azotoformans]MEC1741068.1 accessory gene regulator B family protein [Schinkia azotoformans]MEC1744213.1 accessory gene regulator B family protein [Schinkia azotoformans]MEC1756629.1 accessory gene regulator B family protein [Schinkia azotoformans]MEC1768079.1 accessory gene regulator B family protein [Schinkia azotoformans]
MQQLEQRLVHYLTQAHHTEVEKAKIAFGVKLILSDLSKFIAVYGVAILLDCWYQVIIMHLAFYFLRQVSLGYHFSSNLQCMIGSILLFPVLCKIQLMIALEGNLIILLVSTFILFLFAPVGTKKHGVVNQKHRSYLQKKCWIRLVIILVLYLLLPQNIQPFIALGVSVQAILVIIQFILNKKVAF